MCLLLPGPALGPGPHAESDSCRPVPRAPTFPKRCSETTEHSSALEGRKAGDGDRAGRDVCVFYASHTAGQGQSDKDVFTHRLQEPGSRPSTKA